MSNPWEEIHLDDYENHMKQDSVRQLQAMNSIMQEQFEAYPAETVMILGIAGGNGLEHIRTEKYHTVYGVDINEAYLRAVSERYTRLSDILTLFLIDLVQDSQQLPTAELVIANLLIEYIGYTAFQKAVLRVKPEYVSCVIQINTDENSWVSDSPYLHAFDGLDAIHHQIEEKELDTVMSEIGYALILRKSEALPNGKALVRMDFQKKSNKFNIQCEK